MHGMARRKSVVGLPGTGYALSRLMDHALIRPFLVNESLQEFLGIKPKLAAQ